jgi:predicted glycoside hydrolase/deacetylase ChbG (UPF0249 family)
VTPLILNADDYAMDDGVDAAVLSLAAQGTLTAASAMVLAAGWPEAGRRLADVEISRGLHLDFTSPFVSGSAAPRALPALLGAAFLGRLDQGALERAIGDQLERYDGVMKAPPDFVDGHQHVHQLPGVREALMRALRARYGALSEGIAMRLCLARRWRGLKAAVVAGTGATAFASLAAAGRHPANSDFAGVYGFSPGADLARLWRGWLSGLVGEAPLIMCHVATDQAPASVPDAIRGARLAEWRWLGSSAFRDLCTELGVRLRSWRVAG